MITPVWIVWTGTGDCHPISHPGLSVPNLDAAVAFYSGVLGFYVRMQPSTVTEDDNFDFHRNGTFHCVIKDPDLEGLLARIVAAGGKQRMLVREYFPG